MRVRMGGRGCNDATLVKFGLDVKGDELGEGVNPLLNIVAVASIGRDSVLDCDEAVNLIVAFEEAQEVHPITNTATNPANAMKPRNIIASAVLGLAFLIVMEADL